MSDSKITKEHEQKVTINATKSTSKVADGDKSLDSGNRQPVRNTEKPVENKETERKTVPPEVTEPVTDMPTAAEQAADAPTETETKPAEQKTEPTPSDSSSSKPKPSQHLNNMNDSLNRQQSAAEHLHDYDKITMSQRVADKLGHPVQKVDNALKIHGGDSKRVIAGKLAGKVGWGTTKLAGRTAKVATVGSAKVAARTAVGAVRQGAAIGAESVKSQVDGYDYLQPVVDGALGLPKDVLLVAHDVHIDRKAKKLNRNLKDVQRDVNEQRKAVRAEHKEVKSEYKSAKKELKQAGKELKKDSESKDDFKLKKNTDETYGKARDARNSKRDEYKLSKRTDKKSNKISKDTKKGRKSKVKDTNSKKKINIKGIGMIAAAKNIAQSDNKAQAALSTLINSAGRLMLKILVYVISGLMSMLLPMGIFFLLLLMIVGSGGSSAGITMTQTPVGWFISQEGEDLSTAQYTWDMYWSQAESNFVNSNAGSGLDLSNLDVDTHGNATPVLLVTGAKHMATLNGAVMEDVTMDEAVLAMYNTVFNQMVYTNQTSADRVNIGSGESLGWYLIGTVNADDYENKVEKTDSDSGSVIVDYVTDIPVHTIISINGTKYEVIGRDDLKGSGNASESPVIAVCDGSMDINYSGRNFTADNVEVKVVSLPSEWVTSYASHEEDVWEWVHYNETVYYEEVGHWEWHMVYKEGAENWDFGMDRDQLDEMARYYLYGDGKDDGYGQYFFWDDECDHYYQRGYDKFTQDEIAIAVNGWESPNRIERTYKTWVVDEEAYSEELGYDRWEKTGTKTVYNPKSDRDNDNEDANVSVDGTYNYSFLTVEEYTAANPFSESEQEWYDMLMTCVFQGGENGSYAGASGTDSTARTAAQLMTDFPWLKDTTFPAKAEPILTSWFQPVRTDVAGGGASHNGIDFGIPAGSELTALCDAEVIYVGWQDGNSTYGKNNAGTMTYGVGFGYHIVLQVSDGSTIVYGHMNGDSATVSVGDKVKKGDVIGESGNTGNSTGAHLHLQLQDSGGTAINYNNLASTTWHAISYAN